MFLSLLKKECKMWLKSIVFYAYVIILFLFYVSQMGEEEVIKKPQPGLNNYGMTYTEDQKVIMNGAISSLIAEYESERFITYPVMFYKEVILSKEENLLMEEYISELTGCKKEEWELISDNYISADLTYDSFKEIMKKVSKLIGPGSSYSDSYLKEHGKVPKTYENALSDYTKIVEKEHITGAYARLFSDYLGIILGILPAFFGVTRGIKEKRSKVVSVIYTKRASSIGIVLSRYFGMIIMMLIPLLFVSCFSLSQGIYIANAAGISPDYLAYIKYCTGWLLPTILFVTAVSYLITEMTESILSILVNVVIWYINISKGTSMLLLGAGWNLIPRFNYLGEYELFQGIMPQLIRNRVAYTLVSIIIVGILIAIYEIKRKGGLGIRGKIPKNMSSEY
ncbi:MAG: hypothetical protein K0S61_3406 [Anaerocolumna sp.]|nr:hypothetical protein [Anaerocolumna sp.]